MTAQMKYNLNSKTIIDCANVYIPKKYPAHKYEVISTHFDEETDVVSGEILGTMYHIKFNCGMNVKILISSNWKQVKRSIDVKMELLNKGYADCGICCNEKITRATSCPRCAEHWCLRCQINMFQLKQGDVKCPYCNYQITERQDPYVFLYALSILQDRLG